ncbi:MAG TPA: type I pullulanase [Chitinophagaceae bacterium]|nr:type I pullulanase [Chitinophagaceae bacterium]
MKKTLMLFAWLFNIFSTKAQKSIYDSYPVYKGNDLGLTFSSKNKIFKIWAPTAEQALLILYKEGVEGNRLSTYPMIKKEGGIWETILIGEFRGWFYVFKVMINGQWSNEVPDPYAKAVGVNGKRAMVVDLKETNPAGWEKDKSPVSKNKTDAILYELHIRDVSISDNSGIKNKGKYLGLTETGTKNAEGLSTGLDHIKELGVTHVHLLPCFDFYSLDESQPDKAQYNWGYDPLNYNAPEGSYSTNPYDGLTRIKEFKQMVQAFHQNGLRVVMDVVYNHTRLTEDSYFNQLVPGYYYRQTKDGNFSNATACGNETASERYMMRKFILESVLYWVKEYHIDGLRFDLMGVHDIETMNLISKELHKIKPDILLYGEGWTAGSSPLEDSLRAIKKYAYKLDRIAVFSDDIRDGIKGSVFDHADRGFASAKPGMEESIKFGIVASCKHPQVDYTKVNYSKAPYAAQPWNTITYCECHDNHLLWDKLAISAKDASESERREMDKLAISIVLTSQGISFLHAGTDFLRTKKGVENSFESPDSINAIDWSLKTKNKEVFEYVKGLIKMRKEHPAFRMTSAKQIADHIRFSNNYQKGRVTYIINGQALKDPWKKIIILFNGNTGKRTGLLPPGKWKMAIWNNDFVRKPLTEEGEFFMEAYSCSILYQE